MLLFQQKVKPESGPNSGGTGVVNARLRPEATGSCTKEQPTNYDAAMRTYTDPDTHSRRKQQDLIVTLVTSVKDVACAAL